MIIKLIYFFFFEIPCVPRKDNIFFAIFCYINIGEKMLHEGATLLQMGHSGGGFFSIIWKPLKVKFWN